MKWKALTMPKEIVIDEQSKTPTYARFYIEPLERGFGSTIASRQRRRLNDWKGN